MPIPEWVYPVWGIGVMALILALARRTLGFRWSATFVAVAYIAYRAVMWPLLLGMGFPVSTIPFYLLVVGLAVDLAFTIGREHGLLTAGAGALLVTAFGYRGAVAAVAVPAVGAGRRAHGVGAAGGVLDGGGGAGRGVRPVGGGWSGYAAVDGKASVGVAQGATLGS